MNLTSGLSKRYKKSFVLDEDGIRRIHGVLAKAAKDVTFPASVVFHVEREDDRYYETTDIDEVLSDPNIPGKRVTLVGIELRPATPEPEKPSLHSDWKAMVIYSLREKEGPFPDPDEVRVRIATHDKNWALLLADEIEPQVQRTFKAKATPRWLLLLFVLPFVPLVWRCSQVVPSTLVKSLSGPLAVMVFTLGFLTYFVSRISRTGPRWFARLFGPESTFMWGEECQSYLSREQTRRNIQWTVIVAFFISALAGVVIGFYGIGNGHPREEQLPNKASEATSEPAPSAGPSAPQG